MEFYFYLEKNWSGQNQSSRNISAGPIIYSTLEKGFYYVHKRSWAVHEGLQTVHEHYYVQK